MNALPSAVEQSLLDAGFSGTEILILNRLLSEPYTLRELAARTGKSTGVLDQAMKKLVRKNIVTKKMLNDSSKFTINSLQAILDWMEYDARQKKEILSRRSQNFESFMQSLEQDKHKPALEHYDGLDGLAQAYRKLLECGTDMLQYVPVMCAAEDHPLRDFYVEYFRMRRNKGMFSRVIAHNTALGRRYASRDPFEYRQTLLVPEEQYPFTFEKIIVGDTVASINHAEKRAFLLRSPELAATEKSIFEGIWRGEGERAEEPSKEVTKTEEPQAVNPLKTVIPLGTRTLSALREFFLSRTSIVLFVGFAALSALVTFLLFDYTKNLEITRMNETIRSIASAGVLQMDSSDIDALQKEQDWKKPQWKKVVHQLEQIRRSNDDITFVYIFRRNSNDPSRLDFVADSHSINPYANTDNDSTNNVDADRDGKIDDADVLQWPGQPYLTPPKEAFTGFDKATNTEQIHSDSWGTYLSGYAPILDKNGKSIAVLAVDMSAKTLDDRITSVLEPTALFIGLFILFVFMRLAAFNRSLLQELLQAVNVRKFVRCLAGYAILAGIITYILYLSTLANVKGTISEKVLSIAATGALQFDARDVEELHTVADIHKPEYAKIIAKLNEIRDQNPGIKYAYIMRPTSDPRYFEFVADADSLDPNTKLDLNGDGKIDRKDHLSPPGEKYDMILIPNLKEALNGPKMNDSEIPDQWGSTISAWAPIKDANGRSVAIFGVDKLLDDSKEITTKSFSILPWFLFILIFLLLIRFAAFNPKFTLEVWKFFQVRKFLVILVLCAEISFFITLGLYYYMLRQTIDEIGGKLMVITATAAKQFDVKDLDQLHWARDMKTKEYQKVFTILNTIRESNKETSVKFVYIMRKLPLKDFTEFVADADSNYSLPFLQDDNKDGILNQQDESIWPGKKLFTSNDKNYFLGFKEASYDKNFYTDQWGTWLSGYAPIGPNYLVAADVDISNIKMQLKNKFKFTLGFLSIFSFTLLGYLLSKYKL